MKKSLFLFLLIGSLASCKKAPEASLAPTESETPYSKGAQAKLASAGDGAWDLLGYGYDVVGEYASSNSATYPVIDIARFKADHPTRIESSGAEASSGRLIYGENAEDFSSNLTASVDISNLKLFKASINSSFTENNKFSSKYLYGSYNLEIVKRGVKLMPVYETLLNYLTPSFLSDVQYFTPQQLVSVYGTHVLSDIKLGGRLEITYQSETTTSERKEASKAGIAAAVQKVFNINTQVSYDQNLITKNSAQRIHFRTIGGNSSSALFNTVAVSSTSPSIDISGWQSGVTDQNAELIGISAGGLIPIYELIQDPVKKSAVQAYVNQYLLENQVKVDSEPIYELYNYNLWKHALDHNINAPSLYPGWSMNGQPFKAFVSQAAGTVPVYQFLHKTNYDHVYTTNRYPGFNSNYIYDGIAFYAYKTQVPGSVPIYEFYNNHHVDHFYSTNSTAYMQWPGWTYNSQPFYAIPN